MPTLDRISEISHLSCLSQINKKPRSKICSITMKNIVFVPLASQTKPFSYCRLSQTKFWATRKSYVGETKRTLNIRAEEHITAIKSASKKSHTAEHCWKYNHDFDWKHKKVLDFEKNWKTRTIKESIYSEENEHHINGISFKLPNIWKPILRENKAKKTTAKSTTSSNWVRKGPQSCMVPYRSEFKINQSGTTLEYFDPLQT